MDNFLLPFMGFLTGLIDSVVGGGGLISLPTLSIIIAPGAPAIGQTKLLELLVLRLHYSFMPKKDI